MRLLHLKTLTSESRRVRRRSKKKKKRMKRWRRFWQSTRLCKRHCVCARVSRAAHHDHDTFLCSRFVVAPRVCVGYSRAVIRIAISSPRLHRVSLPVLPILSPSLAPPLLPCSFLSLLPLSFSSGYLYCACTQHHHATTSPVVLVEVTSSLRCTSSRFLCSISALRGSGRWIEALVRVCVGDVGHACTRLRSYTFGGEGRLWSGARV